MFAVLFCASGLSEAIAETNSLKSRTLGLSECIQIALQQNRDLQIERLNPLIALASLSASRGYYDPLQLQSDLARTRSAELRAKSGYNRGLSQLNFAQASILNRANITVETK